jgi:hypothetical protein
MNLESFSLSQLAILQTLVSRLNRGLKQRINEFAFGRYYT